MLLFDNLYIIYILFDLYIEVGCLKHVICQQVSQIIRTHGVDGLASTSFCEAACHDATVLGVFRYLHGMIR